MTLQLRGWRNADRELINTAWWSHQLLAEPAPHPWSHVTDDERRAVLAGGLDGRLWVASAGRGGAVLAPIDWEQRTARLQVFLAAPLPVPECAELLAQAVRLATESLNLVRLTGYLDAGNRPGRLAARLAGFVREAALRSQPDGRTVRLLYGLNTAGAEEAEAHG